MLNTKDFDGILGKLNGTPKIGLFVTRVNCEITRFASIPDSRSFAVNAFTVDWRNFEYYVFPPFAIIPKLTKK